MLYWETYMRYLAVRYLEIFVLGIENMNNSDRMGNGNVRMYDEYMKIRNVCWIIVGCL